MAVNNTHRDGSGSEDGVARDAHLARLMRTAGDEAPPTTLDAAILAAARREVQAGPRPLAQTAGAGGGEPGAALAPMPRAKRNWYMPVSIAAVVVMSASLVTIVYHEKGDELAQPTAARAPAAAPAPTAQAPKEAVEETAARVKAEPARDTAPALKAKTADAPITREAKRDDLARAPAVGGIASGDSTSLRKQVEVPQAAPADARLAERAAGGAGATSAPVTATAKAAPGADAAKPATPAPAAPSATTAPETGLRSEAGAAAPASGVRETRPDPFPAAESAPARQRADAERSMGGTLGDALPPARPAPKSAAKPAIPPAAPTPPVSAAPPAPRAASADDGLSRAAPPPEREGRVLAAPGAKPPAQVQRSMQQATRPPWLSEMDNQPAEKWLERLAQFKREGRSAEADELMAEFRRRFPDHPASVR